MKRLFKNLLFALLILIVGGFLSTGQVIADTAVNYDTMCIQIGCSLYDPNSNVCSASSGTFTASITGQNVKDAFVYFASSSAGFTPEQAAGIVGNLYYESSGVNPTKVQDGGGGGYGIAQFTASTLTAMRSWVTAEGKSPDSLAGQLEFIMYQLNGPESAAKDKVKSTSTAADAAAAFMNGYERPAPATAHLEMRVGYANEILKQAQQQNWAPDAASAVAAATTPSSGCAGSGSPDCTNAAGTTKILCEAKKYEGIYYKWGGAHGGYDAFRAGCPLSAVSDPSTRTNSTADNPGPCGTDCSGLVSVAVDEAFGQKYVWTVAGPMVGDGAQYWQPINMTDAKAGDIVTNSEHVEIVDHVAGGQVFTFGSHYTGSKTGPSSAGLNYYSQAWRWTGPGAS